MKNKILQTFLLTIFFFVISSFVLTPGTVENCNTSRVSVGCGTSSSFGFPFSVFSSSFSEKTVDHIGVVLNTAFWIIVSAIVVFIINYLLNLKKSE